MNPTGIKRSTLGLVVLVSSFVTAPEIAAQATLAPRDAAVRSINDASNQLEELRKSHERTVALNRDLAKLFHESNALVGQQAALLNQSNAKPAQSGTMNEILQQQGQLNAKMLQIQMAMQRENTIFSSISNVLKTKHDTAKNSIGNIR